MHDTRSPQAIAKFCRGAMLVSCAWLIAWPLPYAVLVTVVAAWPWLALVMCRRDRGAYAIDDPGRGAQSGDFTLLLVAPGLVLALRALIDVHLVLVGPLFAPSLAVWGAMVWCAHTLGPGWRPWRRLALLLFALFPYAPSTIALADQAFDGGDATSVRVRVLGKRVTSGKGATRYLRVSPWALRTRPNEIEVERDLYEAVQIGGAVCVLVHPGALGMPWYEAAACDGAAQ